MARTRRSVSVRELALKAGLSWTTTKKNIEKLVKRGWLEWV